MYTFSSNSPVFISVIVAFIATYGVVINAGMPYAGFAVAWAAVSSVVYWYKPIKTRFTKWAYVLSLAICFCFMWRANPLLTFLNFIGAVGLTTVMAMMYDEKTLPGVLRMLLSPLIVLSRTMSTQISYSTDMSTDKLTKLLQKLKFQETFISVLVTLISLVIILPLLASSNPFFKNALDEGIALLNILRLWELFQGWSFTFWTIVQLVVFGFLLVAVPKMIAYLSLQTDKTNKPSTQDRKMVLPKFVIVVVLLLFFVTQIQLYVASDTQLLAVGSTPSQRTQEVFGQLSIVTGIVLGILYFFRSYSLRERRLSWVLLIECVFLTAIAFSSVFQYASNFGFTFKRLWGIAVVFWLVAVLVMYMVAYWKKVANEYVIQWLLLISAVALVAVNVVNFDYLIAHVHQPRTGAGTDYLYLLHQLSADAAADRMLLDAFEKMEHTNDLSAASFARYNQTVIFGRIEDLQHTYENLDIRMLNLGQLRAYRAVKHVDTTVLRLQMSARDTMQPVAVPSLQENSQPSPSPVLP